MGGIRVGRFVLAGLLALHAPAWAQPAGGKVEPATAEGEPAAAAPVKDPAIAKRWQQAGIKLVQKGDQLTRAGKPDEAKAQYENALIAYQKAIEASDDQSLYFDLASVEDKLGMFVPALKHYRLVAAATTGIKPELVKKASAKRDEDAGKVGVVTLTVKPDGATVMLGGTELGLAPLPEPLVLLPGTYALSFDAPGFQHKEAELKIEAGSESERAIELDEMKIVVQPMVAEHVRDVPAAAPHAPSRLPLYVGGGVAIGLAGVAVVTGILAIGQHGDYTSADTNTLDRIDAKANGEHLALATDILLGTAVVAAGFTTYWYFVKYKGSKPKQESSRTAPMITKLDVAPWVQSQTGGVLLGGAF